MSRSPARLAPLTPTAVNTVLEEIRAVQALGRDVVSLMRGEPDFPTPPHITEAALKALRAGRTRYPDNRGELALREAVATKLLRENGLAYDPRTEILITTGATLGIHTALMATIDSGDEVLLPDPVYDAYVSPVRLLGGAIHPVRATIEQDRFVLTAEALEAAITPRTRAIVLNTPWNPVGTVLRASELRIIADLVVRHDLALISDEIYEAIVYDGHRHVSPAGLSDDIRSRTVLVNSLSKTYAMTGWRVGYCAAPKPVIDAMFLVLQQSSRGPATFVQDAATAALAGSQTDVADMQRQYAARRTHVLEALSGLPRVRVLPPEGGFFAMLDVREVFVQERPAPHADREIVVDRSPGVTPLGLAWSILAGMPSAQDRSLVST